MYLRAPWTSRAHRGSGCQVTGGPPPTMTSWWSATAGWTQRGAAMPKSSSRLDPDCRATGIGSFILEHLEEEAAKRGLNHVHNTVRETHPDRDGVHDWLAIRGYKGGSVIPRCASMFASMNRRRTPWRQLKPRRHPIKLPSLRVMRTAEVMSPSRTTSTKVPYGLGPAADSNWSQAVRASRVQRAWRS